MTIEVLNEILDYLEIEFKVSALIVKSGQRIVYSANSSAGDRCVLKTCSLNPTDVARVQREIKILSEMHSDSFPRVYHSAFVTKETLQNFIDRLDPRSQKERIESLNAMTLSPFFFSVEEYIEHLSWKECESKLQDERCAIVFLRDLFMALQLLWDKKIVHRDLKPENILVRPNMKPVVIDLGIAKSFNDGTVALTHAMFRSPCTPQYAAPEQLFDSKADVHYKTDQFAVGVILFKILSGRFPFGAYGEIGPEQMMKNMVDGNVEKLRSYNTKFSDGFIRLIERLIKVPPYQRFRSSGDILSELNQLEEILK